VPGPLLSGWAQEAIAMPASKADKTSPALRKWLDIN
jgi:hypothetical protein